MESFSALSRNRSYRLRVLKLVGIAVLAIAIIYGTIIAIEKTFGGTKQSGSPGSSYATVDAGVRAWSELLSLNGYSVFRDRGRVTLPQAHEIDFESSKDKFDLLRKTSTLVVLAGALPKDEIKEVQQFVRAGGRLITDNPYILEALFGSSISVSQDGARNLVTTSAAEALNAIEELEGSGVGKISIDSDLDAIALAIEAVNKNSSSIISESRIDANVAMIHLGRGDVIALMDTAIVSNNGLDRKDNALFALRIAGEKGSDVIFAEGIHGFSEARGFAGMPLNWRIAIVSLIASFILYLCAMGRRFGVGETPHRNLGPRRIYFARALAYTLQRAKPDQINYPSTYAQQYGAYDPNEGKP